MDDILIAHQDHGSSGRCFCNDLHIFYFEARNKRFVTSRYYLHSTLINFINCEKSDTGLSIIKVE